MNALKLPPSPHRMALKRARVFMQIAREWFEIGNSEQARLNRVAARGELKLAARLRTGDKAAVINFNHYRAMRAKGVA